MQELQRAGEASPQRMQPLCERLAGRREDLERQLQEVKELQEILQRNPDMETILTLLTKVGLHY